MAHSTRLPTRTGMVPNLQAITLLEGGLTIQQLASITDAINNLVRAVNGRLTFGDGTHSSQSGNIDGQLKEVFLGPGMGADIEVPHGLGRVPIGIIVLSVDPDNRFVRASNMGSWTPTRLFIRGYMSGATIGDETATARFVVV